MFKKIITKRGFTLLEILLVVGIIAVLAGIVIIAINPSKQLATVRNTQRKSNLAEINKAVQQYYIDNSTYPGGTSLVSTLTEICNTGAIPATTTSVTGASCGTLTNLSDLVPTYLVAIPVDPQGSPVALLTKIAQAATLGTGYQIMKDANNKIGLSSLGAEQGAVITLGPVPATPPSTLGDGLIAHYLMNDISGFTLSDTKGHNGTSTQDISLMATTSGRIGGALAFDGTVDSIDIGSLLTSAPFSVSVWVNVTDFDYGGAWPAIFRLGIDGSGNSLINTQVWDGSGFALQHQNVGALYTTGNYLENTWYNLIVTFDGSVGHIYVNGIEDDAGGSTPSISLSYQTIGNVTEGIITSVNFLGSMDDLRVYNRILTGAERAQLATGTEAE